MIPKHHNQLEHLQLQMNYFKNIAPITLYMRTLVSSLDKIFKKLLFITAFLSFNVSALSNHAYPQNSYVGSGLYLGLGAQQDFGDVEYHSNSTFILGLLGTASENADISATGYSGIALIGFGVPLACRFYLGAEAQGVASNQEGNLSVNSFFNDGPQVLGFKARIKYLNNYGIFIRPGYYASPNYLLFLKGGYINGGFQVAAVPSELNSVVPSLDDVAQKERVGGYLLGAGIEMHLFKNLSGRAEYDFMNYSSFNTNTTMNFLIPGTTSEWVTAFTRNTLSPKTGVATLALTYAFTH